MTRNERQDLAIEKWKTAKCRGTIVAATGVGSCSHKMEPFRLSNHLNYYKPISGKAVMPTPR